jgi:hypothetical protein
VKPSSSIAIANSEKYANKVNVWITPVHLQAHKRFSGNMVSGLHWMTSIRTLSQSVTNEILTSEYYSPTG